MTATSCPGRHQGICPRISWFFQLFSSRVGLCGVQPARHAGLYLEAEVQASCNATGVNATWVLPYKVRRNAISPLSSFQGGMAFLLSTSQLASALAFIWRSTSA